MRRTCTAAIIAVATPLFLLVGIADRAHAADRKLLKEELLEIYSITKTGATLTGGLRITRPGTVLVVQESGIVGAPSSEGFPPTSIVEDGTVRQTRGVMGILTEKESTRTYEPGERVYVTGLMVRTNSVLLDLTTVDTFDVVMSGTTKQVRYAGSLRFDFPQEEFDAMAATDIKLAIDRFLPSQEEMDNAEPPTIELGQTLEVVESILGKPTRIVKAGDKTIYIYPDLKITFEAGTVASVE